jgi:cAMP phosphodiesterase
MEGDFTLTKLDIPTPSRLEVVWGLVKPRVPTKQFKGIIICSFYSVPHSTQKTKLIEHITINYSVLKAKHKDCFFLMGGDKNDVDLKQLLDIVAPSLHMMNTKPTY